MYLKCVEKHPPPYSPRYPFAKDKLILGGLRKDRGTYAVHAKLDIWKNRMKNYGVRSFETSVAHYKVGDIFIALKAGAVE